MMLAQCAEKIPHGQEGMFPHDSENILMNNSLTMPGREFHDVLERIERKQAAIGVSDRELSMRAVGKPDLLRDMRRRQGLPRGDRLAEIARVLGTTSDWLLNGGDEGEAEARAKAALQPVQSEVVGTGLTEEAWAMSRNAKPVPLLGSAIGGTYGDLDEHVELTELHLGEVLDYLARPPSLADDKAAYAVTVVGDSMAPRFEPGEQAFVSPRATVGIGDDVIVQLKGAASEEGEAAERVTMVLIKRLVRRTSAYVELAQFNPPMTFRVPAERVAAIHRVRGRL
jgi:phage repressor protein C with HTH and peptisase S24 domain